MSHFNNINVGVTGFVFDSRYTFTGLGYLAICWQKQWGINIGGAVQTSTLPITFTNVFLAVASTSTEWCCPGCSATNTTVTTRAYQSNRPDVAQPNDVNWIVIGCQPQWGYAALTSQNKSVSTNITMLNNNYIVQLTSDFTVTSDGYGALACVSRSTTNFIVTKDFGETNKHAFWLIIG